MSEAEQNVELARRAIDAFQAGDVESFLALMDPDVEVFSDPELPNSGTFRGHEGYMRWTMEWLDAWDDFRIEAQEFEPVGDRHVLIAVLQRGRGKGSGVEVEMRAWYMAEFRDGAAVRMHLYSTREQAFEAARAGEAESS